MKFSSKKQAYDFHRDTLCAYGGASLVVTSGVKAFDDWNRKVLGAVVEFKAFTPDNDPYGEHDMGFFEVDGVDFMFKWDDYTDVVPEAQLPDGMGPFLLTVMRADEN